MRSWLRRSLLALSSSALATLSVADTVVLTSGRRIDAQQAWFEGQEVRYRRDGALFRVPRGLVERIETASGGPPLDPDVVLSREKLAAGDPKEALRFARLALFRDGGSTAGLQALAEAQLALGDAARARSSAESAIALDPRDARSHEALGDALAELADFVAAREEYRAALELDPQPRLQQKLDTLFSSAASASSARFRVQYDGGADEPLGLAVLRVLDAAWDEYAGTLGFGPAEPVTVVLQTATSFRDTTRAPEWAAAWNDGTIRVPVMGLTAPTAGLVRVLRHELAHSFVTARADGGCPTWLHEGVAQWLEGGDPAREDAALAARARTRPLARLESLESPFVGLSEADAAAAYAESLSAVAHVLRLRGAEGLRRLLEAIGAGRPPAEALPAALSLSYGEFQRNWEQHLLKAAASAATR
ncbi:MAG: peptidase MA family metallohydrolase [Betaproteobacteria bacterium]